MSETPKSLIGGLKPGKCPNKPRIDAGIAQFETGIPRVDRGEPVGFLQLLGEVEASEATRRDNNDFFVHPSLEILCDIVSTLALHSRL